MNSSETRGILFKFSNVIYYMEILEKFLEQYGLGAFTEIIIAIAIVLASVVAARIIYYIFEKWFFFLLRLNTIKPLSNHNRCKGYSNRDIIWIFT